MKKIALLLACIAMVSMVSCDSSSKYEKRQAELADSLSTAMAEKDSLFALLTEVSEAVGQIKEMEQLMAGGGISRETPDQREQLKNDLALIQQAMQARREKLNKLEANMKKSANYNAEMKKTIESLRSQIESQESTIAQLTADLENANAQIRKLNVRVDSLNEVNRAVNKEMEAAQNEALQLTNQLNECYYVVGSKKELKEHNIIKGGFLRKTKLMQDDFEQGYFTKADKRELNKLNLHSKKAKVMSNHPKGSYSLVDEGGIKMLVIEDAAKFWSLSNYLVVQVD